MVIRERESLSICEAGEIVGTIKETDKTEEIKKFVKRFCKITPAKAKKIREEIEKLELLKLKPQDIAKIIDILPEDAIELNKIFTEITLDADETNKILETIKNNK